jgi:GAF domain-containing protein
MQIIKGMDRHLDITQAIRPDGISMHVMRSGEPERINNTMEKKDKVNPFLLENGIAAALCLPFSLHGKPIGVMWINYDKPRRFPDYEVGALQLYVNQAAIAYENARRVKELNQLHQAAEAMSGKHDLKSLLRTIVEEAAKMFDAASSTVWPYDYDKKKFIPKDATSIGIPEDELEVLKNIEPVPGGTTFSALERGWLGVHDISDPSYEFLRESTRDLLERNGLKSFQAITLRVGEEPVGILYVSYAQMRAFRKEDRSALESFATYAALSLKNGKLLDQLKRAKKAAKVVAQVTALGRPEEKLPSIADGTLEAVGCDAVVLYAYDPSRGKFIYPPTHAGVKYPKDAWPDDKMPSSSIVFKIFEEREPRIAERVEQDPLLKDRRFSRVEEIKSCVAIPLQAGNQSVGVMFVNYREPHRFTADDLSNIELFAYQAAVAIRNAQLFSEQESLMKLSRELLGTVSLPGAVSMPGILDRAVATAASMLNTEFCDIVLPDNERNLTIRAAVGAKKDLVGTKVGPDSHTAFIISEKKPVPVDDYYHETRFTPPSTVTDYEIKSGLGVPMFKGGDRMHVLGAMLVQTRSGRHFDEGEINLLSLIANLTAIAIQSAEQYAELQQRERHLLAVLTASDQKEGLDRILEEAVERIRGTDGEKAIFATFQHYDKESNSLTFTNAYPQANPLMVQVGDKVSLESTHGGKKIGVTGRAALTRKPQLVPDVTLDPDYFESYPGICSEIAVPVLDDDTLIGVLNIEHRKLNAFNEHDRDALQYLADLAVVAIRIAEQAEKLIQAREIAAMGIWYAELTHDIEAGVGNIRETIMIAEQYNPQEKIQHLLQSLDDAAEKLRIPRLPLRPSFAEKAPQQIEALLDKIVEDEVNLHRSESPWIVFNPELNCPGVKVAIDPIWLNRLVRHFLLNATQNMPRDKEDRRIIVHTKTHGNFAEIEVEDTGKGVPPELHAYLFRPNPNRNQRGRGLLLVRYIAECHGGQAFYRPGDTGQGSCFALRLPLAN